MNSQKVIVSGKNATTSIFITISESQKEQAERVEYEIKNSHTSTEEEDDDDETMYDSEEDNEDLSNLDLEEEYRFHKRRIEKLEEELLNERKMKEKEILHGRNYEKLFNGLKDESEILQLSVTNHEKKYETLQNLYCEEKQRRIDAEDQYKIKKLWTQSDDCVLDKNDECKCDDEESDDDDDKSYYKGDHDLCDRCDEILPNNCTCDVDEDIKKLVDEKEEAMRLSISLKNELEILQLSVTNHEKKYETLQNLYCEEKQRRINAYKENTELEAKVKELRKQFLDYEEEYYVKIKEDNKKLEDENKKLKIELKEERIFRRDNEDNFFRLLDEHRRLEKVMKNVTI